MARLRACGTELPNEFLKPKQACHSSRVASQEHRFYASCRAHNAAFDETHILERVKHERMEPRPADLFADTWKLNPALCDQSTCRTKGAVLVSTSKHKEREP